MSDLWRIDLSYVEHVTDGDIPDTVMDTLTEPATRLDCERAVLAFAAGYPFVPDTWGDRPVVTTGKMYRVTRCRIVPG